MIAWADVSTTLGVLLDDTEESEFTESNKIWAWNAAQRHFVVHTPRQRICTGVTVDSSGRIIILPDDFYEMARLYDSIDEKYWDPSGLFEPGAFEDRTSDVDTWSMWGNELHLNSQVSSSNSFELWYYAYWPEVEYQESDDVVTVTQGNIIVPRWSETALLNLSVAFILFPKSVQAAMSRQWNMMIDSGNPIMNVRMQEAWDKYKWYKELISHYPPLAKGGYA